MTALGPAAQAVAWVEDNADRLRAFGNWNLQRNGARRDAIRTVFEPPTYLHCCPLSALTPGEPEEPQMAGAHARAHQMDAQVAIRLVDAADGRCPDTDPVRRALLAALNLQ